MQDWLKIPIGIDAQRWITRVGCRTVLVAVHTMATCHRLLDVVDYVESDPRVQVVFTVAPDAFNHGVAHHLRQSGCLVLPWQQATREPFDLALAAACGGLHELHAPLMVMAHGAGRGTIVRPPAGSGPTLTIRQVYGLDAQRLTRDGRVLASAMLLAHEGERDVLRRQCPEALDVALVAGDPCFDRLVASVAWRERYRRAFGVDDGRRLVVVSSTWGRDGLFGNALDLLPTMTDQLPADRFRVAALLHPAVWGAHGTRQVRAWLRDCHDAGLILPGPGEDWRALVVAADYVVGDHGSVTAYSAAVGKPLLCLGTTGTTVPAHGSVQELVLARAGRLDPAVPLMPQLHAARPVDPIAVVDALTSRPGRAERLIRGEMYRLLRLVEPGTHRRASPVPVPDSGPGGWGA